MEIALESARRARLVTVASVACELDRVGAKGRRGCDALQSLLTTLADEPPQIGYLDPMADYDQIILLMEGEVLATGTHHELMAVSPEYVQLYDSQRSTSHYELHA